MGEIECAVMIARPCAEVFDYFLNPDQYVAKSNPEVQSVVRSPEGPTRPGTTFLFRHTGRPRQTRSRFTTVVPDREIRFDGEVGPLRPQCVLIFAPTADGTELTMQADPKPIGPLRILSPSSRAKAPSYGRRDCSEPRSGWNPPLPTVRQKSTSGTPASLCSAFALRHHDRRGRPTTTRRPGFATRDQALDLRLQHRGTQTGHDRLRGPIQFGKGGRARHGPHQSQASATSETRSSC
jgi:hypothetical protein